MTHWLVKMTVQFKFRVGQLSRMRFINSSDRKDPCVLLLFCPGFSGTAFVLLGSRLLWVPPHYCVFVLYCPGFSGTAFGSFRVPASLGPSPTLVCFCFSVPASLGQFFAGPGLSGSLPLFSRCMVWVILMHRLTAWP